MLSHEPMKLYKLYIENGQEYGDFDWQEKLVVAKNKKAAALKAMEWLGKQYGFNHEGDFIPSYEVEEVEWVDGYKIYLVKGK